jgi:hypothetical protein
MAFEPFIRAEYIASGHADDFVRSVINDFDEWTGESEWTEGVIVKADVTSDDIATYVSEAGDPWMSESRNFAPGPYLLKQDNNGIVWAIAYETAERRDADYSDFQVAYAEWADTDGED